MTCRLSLRAAQTAVMPSQERAEWNTSFGLGEKRLAWEAMANESGSVSRKHNAQVLRSGHSKIRPANNMVKSARSV
jgi:hypothetical protein